MNTLPAARADRFAALVADNTAQWWRQREAASEELADAAQSRGWASHRDAKDRGARRITASLSDAEIRRLADGRARIVGEWLDGLAAPLALPMLARVLIRLDARPFAYAGERPEADQLRSFTARASCALWWRRQLRRAVVALREHEAHQRGEVCATRRQPYVTHDTAARRAESVARNAATLAATYLENRDGQCMTLADLAAVSTANKSIRRGELMTRIRGCEALAQSMQHRGLFLTLTAPSRFHRVKRSGESNPRADGSDGPMQPNGPRAAHEWLQGTWTRARAALARAKVAAYGFRVAEPHHDGCPHWHALLWVATDADAAALVRVIRAAWLKDHGEEPGAAEHRVKAVAMLPGGASAYIAKYIAKNVDDVGSVGVEGHHDDARGDDLPEPAQKDAFGGTAQRVEAWAAAHRIRQFQAIGQPPVGVWRELRRIAPQRQGGASPDLVRAFWATSKAPGRRADWALYVLAQGGLMQGRDYRIRIATVSESRAGRYETTEAMRPVGVFDALHSPDAWHLSERAEWKPRGEWAGTAAAFVPPWTRVSNCTSHVRSMAPVMRVAGKVMSIRAPLRAWLDQVKGAGGLDHHHESPYEPDYHDDCSDRHRRLERLRLHRDANAG